MVYILAMEKEHLPVELKRSSKPFKQVSKITKYIPKTS
jgi:hypothetical protein